MIDSTSEIIISTIDFFNINNLQNFTFLKLIKSEYYIEGF
nr:MAG TPA: hypothetical protein [Caudoviricetes sp.]